nr:MAG TPA: hypothetical protein [Caudoviricetes sp.]
MATNAAVRRWANVPPRLHPAPMHILNARKATAIATT